MPTRIRSAVAVAACVFASATACGGHHSSAQGPTSTTPPTQPSTPTTIDVTKVPAVIDVAYASAVMKVIDHVHGEAARHLYEAKQVDARVKDLLKAIFTSEEYDGEVRNFQQDLTNGLNQAYLAVPGDPVTTVKSVLSSSPRCIVMDASVDFSPFFQQTKDPVPGVIQLGLKGPPFDLLPINTTPWLVEVAGTPTPGQDLNRACANIR